MQDKILDNKYYRAEMQDGIMIVQYKPGLHITLKEAREIVQARLDHFGNISYPVIFKSSRVKSIDKAARSYLFKEGHINLKAIALIEQTKVEKVMLSIMLNFDRPPIPCRAFDNEMDAIAWLQDFK
ncbi:MAG: STAS/SEC14 domain-containing protein [Cyclobacteriaceae bacterium]